MRPRVVLALAIVCAIGAKPAGAQSAPPPVPTAGPSGALPVPHHAGPPPTAGMHHHAAAETSQPDRMPAEPGQAAFGAIQEIVRMLQADSATDWSKVDIDALRQHLIDMDALTLYADASKQPIDSGLRILVTGSGRTLEAIRRMVPAHAKDIDGLYGWSVRADSVPDGEALTVTGNTPADTRKIRGLGFMGIMALGTHQMHHLAMAKGAMDHMR